MRGERRRGRGEDAARHSWFVPTSVNGREREREFGQIEHGSSEKRKEGKRDGRRAEKFQWLGTPSGERAEESKVQSWPPELIPFARRIDK